MSKFKIEPTQYTVTDADNVELNLGIVQGGDNKMITVGIGEGLYVWLTAEQAKQVAEHIVKLADVIGGE